MSPNKVDENKWEIKALLGGGQDISCKWGASFKTVIEVYISIKPDCMKEREGVSKPGPCLCNKVIPVHRETYISLTVN